MADIRRIGRRHLAEHGAAALSLRAVARDLGVVSSAVYRYVPSRDALLTLLIEDAYTDLGAAVTKAEQLAPREDFRGRWLSIAHAVRRWALAEPARYGLLYGSPVPGYAAPAERTSEPGTRVPRLVIELMAEAHAAGKVRPIRGEGVLTDRLRQDLAAIMREVGAELPDELVAALLLGWVSLFGTVSFEVFGQYGVDTISTPEALFEHQITTLAETIGL